MNFNLKAENINYIKIQYEDKNGFLHVTKAAVKRIDSKEIFASAKFEEDLSIKTPQTVSVSFVEDDGIYKTKTDLKYITQEEEYIYFSLKLPEKVDYYQNREYFRVKLFENVIISFEEGNETKSVSCKTHDISANGICVNLNETMAFPEEVQISILFESREIKTRAKYIRTDKEEKNIKASFHFLDLKENDLDYISKICIQKQLEQRRISRL